MRYKVYASISYKNETIIGRNSLKSHPIMLKYCGINKIYMHAEIDAIQRANNKWGKDAFKQSSMKIWRDVGKVRSMAAPCEGCMRCIIAFGINKVEYTDWKGKWQRLI